MTVAVLIGAPVAHALATVRSEQPPARLAVGSSPPDTPATSELPGLIPIDGRSAAGLLASAAAAYGIEATSGRGQGGTDEQCET
jgi:hypothetical protein